MAFIKKNILWIISIVILLVTTITFGVNLKVKSRDPVINVVGNYAYTPAQVANVMNRTLNSSFQVSDQRVAIVSYNVLITNTATLILGNNGQILLETSPNNSVWTTVSTGQSSVGSGLVFSGANTVSVFGFVPRGYFVRIRSNNVTGTPIYSTPAGIEILIN